MQERPGEQVLPGQHGWFLAAPHAHSQPFALFPSQSPKPVLHAVNVPAPAGHATLVALRTLSHLFEHDPQCATSVRMFVSQPVLPLSQCKNPLAHVQLHIPLAHAGVPFVVAHAAPQPPHASGSPWVLTHSPWQQSPVTHGFPGGLQLSTHAPLGLHDLLPVH